MLLSHISITTGIFIAGVDYINTMLGNLKDFKLGRERVIPPPVIDQKSPCPRFMKTLILTLIIPLLLAPTAMATSESSYKMGLKYGHDEYQKCDRICLNLDLLGAECQTSSYVDNVTACNDGYGHVWIHEGGQTSVEVGKCIISGHNWDAGGCQSGRLVAITSPGHCYNNGTCESGGWTPVHQTEPSGDVK